MHSGTVSAVGAKRSLSCLAFLLPLQRTRLVRRGRSCPVRHSVLRTPCPIYLYATSNQLQVTTIQREGEGQNGCTSRLSSTSFDDLCKEPAVSEARRVSYANVIVGGVSQFGYGGHPVTPNYGLRSESGVLWEELELLIIDRPRGGVPEQQGH